MRTGILLCLFFGFCLISTTSFKAKETTVDDKTLLDIVANHPQMALYNYEFQRAIIKCTVTKFGKATHGINYNPTVYASRSGDKSTHGLKVFKLYVKDNNAYAYNNVQPEGQTLVKATWYSEKMHKQVQQGKMFPLNNSTYLKPTLGAEYFIMLKATTVSYATDQGWIYGIVSADGKSVIEKGLIKSCMGCHDESKEDRMLHAR